MVSGVIGLVLGWAIRPLCLRFDYTEPNVSFTSIGALFFVAAIIGARRTPRAGPYAATGRTSPTTRR